MRSKDKPYILYVAEKIYLEIFKIKKKNNSFKNIKTSKVFLDPNLILATAAMKKYKK